MWFVLFFKYLILGKSDMENKMHGPFFIIELELFIFKAYLNYEIM